MAQRMAMRMVMQRACNRCGLQTTSDHCCESCERDLSIHRERLLKMLPPHCGECGDSGKLPERAWRTYGFDAYDAFPVECPACPCCDECGCELRLHDPQTMECP